LQEFYSKDDEKHKNELTKFPHLGFFTDKQALDNILQEEGKDNTQSRSKGHMQPIKHPNVGLYF
jgi:hypothetical protein